MFLFTFAVVYCFNILKLIFLNNTEKQLHVYADFDNQAVKRSTCKQKNIMVELIYEPILIETKFIFAYLISKKNINTTVFIQMPNRTR